MNKIRARKKRLKERNQEPRRKQEKLKVRRRQAKKQLKRSNKVRNEKATCLIMVLRSTRRWKKAFYPTQNGELPNTRTFLITMRKFQFIPGILMASMPLSTSKNCKNSSPKLMLISSALMKQKLIQRKSFTQRSFIATFLLSMNNIGIVVNLEKVTQVFQSSPRSNQ